MRLNTGVGDAANGGGRHGHVLVTVKVVVKVRAVAIVIVIVMVKLTVIVQVKVLSKSSSDPEYIRTGEGDAANGGGRHGPVSDEGHGWRHGRRHGWYGRTCHWAALRVKRWEKEKM